MPSKRNAVAQTGRWVEQPSRAWRLSQGGARLHNARHLPRHAECYHILERLLARSGARQRPPALLISLHTLAASVLQQTMPQTLTGEWRRAHPGKLQAPYLSQPSRPSRAPKPQGVCLHHQVAGRVHSSCGGRTSRRAEQPYRQEQMREDKEAAPLLHGQR